MTDDQNEDGPRGPLSSPQTAEPTSGVVPVGPDTPEPAETNTGGWRWQRIGNGWYSGPPIDPDLAAFLNAGDQP